MGAWQRKWGNIDEEPIKARTRTICKRNVYAPWFCMVLREYLKSVSTICRNSNHPTTDIVPRNRRRRRRRRHAKTIFRFEFNYTRWQRTRFASSSCVCELMADDAVDVVGCRAYCTVQCDASLFMCACVVITVYVGYVQRRCVRVRVFGLKQRHMIRSCD